MTINKFQGKTENEAIEKAKREMGPDVVIMNVKVIKPSGVFRAFKSITYEVTAALEEGEKAQAPTPAVNMQPPKPESINLAADEQIHIPFTVPQEVPLAMPVEPKEMLDHTKQPVHPVQQLPESVPSSKIEERLDNLQSLLEERISAKTGPEEIDVEEEASRTKEGFSFVKMLYQTLLDNEVDEKYANQILDELEKVSSNGNNIDYILSHIYQKLVLKFGQPRPIEIGRKKPKIAFFVGPTGVGKTTTIAKIASRYKVDEGRKVAFLTADTYRIAATEQLRTYANILDMSLTIVYSPEEIKEAVDKMADLDLILIDTAGFSHKNTAQCEDVKNLIQGASDAYECEVYLVLSATTKYSDLQEICDIYRTFADYKIIFTKLDETSCCGNLLNIHLYSGADLSYATYGQNVPDDIEIFNTQKIVKKLLGGD